MPGISDPGARLVRACAEAEITYTVIPGASAVQTAVVGSGLDAERFYYGGFLPTKSGQRERELQAAADRMETTVVFESPHRLTKTLGTLSRLAPQRLICVARELTKQHEEYRRGIASDLLRHYEASSVKGEITLLISGRPKRESKSNDADGN